MVQTTRFFRQVVREPLWIAAALWPLALLAPFIPWIPRPTLSGPNWRQEVVVAVICGVTLMLLALKRRKLEANAPPLTFQRTELFALGSLALFVLWNAVSALWAVGSYAALHHALVWGGYLIFFLLVRRVAARPRLLRASITTLAFVIFIISVSCIIGFWGSPKSLFRANGLGEPLAVASPLFASLALCLRRRRAALLCGVTGVLAWLAMLQAFERSPFIGASIGFTLLAVMFIALPQLRPRSWRRAALLVGSFLFVTALQTMPLPIAPAVSQGHPMVLSRVASISTSEPNTRSRLLFWGIALEMVREHPFIGVGASNYDVAFPTGRAAFSAKHPDSPLVEMYEGFLTQAAHNEYLQILSELGVIGLTLFAVFCAVIVWTAIVALRGARSPLVQGAIASLTTFAISSGASSISFRWLGSGLLFFFAAAIASHFAFDRAQDDKPVIKFSTAFAQRVLLVTCAFSLVFICGMCAQGLNVITQARAQTTLDASEAERLYQSAFFWNPIDPATHFNYGLWLYYQGRANEAAKHIRYATERGIDTSVSYAYQSAAETEAGDSQTAQETLAYAIRVFPRSTMLRTRYASALTEAGKTAQGANEYATALSIDEPAARGWWTLIRAGKEAAATAAQRDAKITPPGALAPPEAVPLTIAEYKRHPIITQTEFGELVRVDSH